MNNPEIAPESFTSGIDPEIDSETESEIDPAIDALLPFSDLIATLADYEKQRIDSDTGQVLTVEAIAVHMPVELRVSVDDSGQVTLKGSPPTQRTETAVLPVFHQMKLRIVEARYGQ